MAEETTPPAATATGTQDPAPTSTTPPATTSSTTTDPKPTETVEFWKAQARENEKRAKANADAATKLAEIEEAQKSEAQKQADQLAAALKRAADAEHNALRLRVAATAGLPAELIDRLRGDNEAEMTADAEALLKLVKPNTGPKPDPAQGGSTPPAGTVQAGRDLYADRKGRKPASTTV